MVQPGLSSAQKDLVREQLARILASPLFSHSRRFPDFLRYTVNRALDEDTNSIKERTLGVEVFGRDPDYDTSLDPVVRMTAVEIRKRLTQYYQLPNHAGEPRIEFARGSYVPEFKFPAAEPLPASRPTEPPPIPFAAKDDHNKSRWLITVCAGIPLVLITGLLLSGTTRRTPLELFWSPVVASKSPVLICIPDLQTIFSSIPPTIPANDPASSFAQTISQLPLASRRDKVSFGDSMAVSMVAGILGGKGKGFRVRHTEDVGLDDLKEGPVVLIGAYSNQWEIQLGGALRYSFVKEGSTHYIRDSLNPSSRQWIEGPLTSGNSEIVDYALISRVLDPTTGRLVITAAGIQEYGTQAAGECITDASCFEDAEKIAPGDWTKSNIQILIETTVIGENPGKARVLAARVW
jgi:hypothetical protein